MNENTEGLAVVDRLNRDTVAALKRAHPGGVTDSQARFLLDEYYNLQKARIRNGNYIKGLERDAKKTGTDAEPHTILDHFYSTFAVSEENVAKIMTWYIQTHEMSWFFENTLGIGPILSAGLLAFIDIEKCPTVGHIWSFAGLNPEAKWEKGTKRPWNATLKTLVWKIGDSFVKLSGRNDCLYANLYKERKALEWKKNLAGEFVDAANASMEKKKYGKNTDQFAWYTGQCSPEKVAAQLKEKNGSGLVLSECLGEGGFPMLSPAHIDARARRYAVKIFLSHLHECWHQQHYGKPAAAPFAISIKGHAHYIEPPQVLGRAAA